MFSTLEAHALFLSEARRHPQPIDRRFLADWNISGMRTLERVTEHKRDHEPLLTWDAADEWLFNEAARNAQPPDPESPSIERAIPDDGTRQVDLVERPHCSYRPRTAAERNAL